MSGRLNRRAPTRSRHGRTAAAIRYRRYPTREGRSFATMTGASIGLIAWKLGTSFEELSDPFLANSMWLGALLGAVVGRVCLHFLSKGLHWGLVGLIGHWVGITQLLVLIGIADLARNPPSVLDVLPWLPAILVIAPLLVFIGLLATLALSIAFAVLAPPLVLLFLAYAYLLNWWVHHGTLVREWIPRVLKRNRSRSNRASAAVGRDWTSASLDVPGHLPGRDSRP